MERQLGPDSDGKWRDANPKPTGVSAQKKQKSAHESCVLRLVWSRYHRFIYLLPSTEGLQTDEVEELSKFPLMKAIVDKVDQDAASGELQSSAFSQIRSTWAGLEDFAVW